MALIAACLLAATAVCAPQEPAPDVPTEDAVDLPAPPVTVVDESAPPIVSDDEPESTDEAAAGGEPEAEDTGEPVPEGEPELAEDEIEVHADQVTGIGGATYARGNVRVRHQDIVVTADEVEIDEDAVWAQFTGSVVIDKGGLRTTGSTLRVNLETGAWSIEDGKTTIEPGYFEASIAEPVFVQGSNISQSADGNTIEVADAEVTSCDLGQIDLHEHSRRPHYDLRTERCRVRLGRDITLWYPEVHGLGSRLFRYPAKLKVSLKDRRSRIISEFGHNTIEGYYVKLGYPYGAGRSANGLARLHLSTERGVGFGAEHWFDNGQSAGELSLFLEPQEGAYSTRVRHRFQYSPTWSSSLSGSVQENSGYGFSSTTSYSSDLTVQHDSDDSHTTLGFQHSGTSGSTYSSGRFTNNFTHRQRGPADIDWSVRSVYQANSFSSADGSDEELNVNLDLRRSHEAFDWELGYKQRFDVDRDRYQQDNNYSSLDELPSIVLRSDTERLGIGFGVPIQTRLELGQFRQQPDDYTISRLSMYNDIYGQRIRLAEGHELTTGASFRQSFYSDGSAQYSGRSNASFQSSWGGPWYSRVRWDWQLAEGVSPIRLDYASKQHDVQMDLSHYVANRSRIEVQTGFDIRRNTWRDMIMRAEYTPNEQNRIELQTAYDIERSEFRPLEARWQFVKYRHLDVEMAASYDIDRSELARMQLDTDWVVSPRWRLESLIGYNGFQEELDYLEARVTRDLHCWLGSLAYSFSQREIRVNFSLKAFPFGDWEYGLGGSGERLTPRSGQYY